MRRLLIILGVLLVIGLVTGGLVYQFGTGIPGGPGGTAKNAVKVRVEEPRLGELFEVVSAPGKVVPKTKVSISARVVARIVELPKHEGAQVKAGDLLVQLDSSEIESQLRAAEARKAAQIAQIKTSEARLTARESQLGSVRVQLTSKLRDLKRQEQLLQGNDVAQAAVDDALTAVDQLKAQLEGEEGGVRADRVSLEVQGYELAAADAEIERVRDALSYTKITSPIDGIVTRLNAEVGELVMTGTMNNAGTVILEVADLDRMIVELRVDEADVARLAVGQKAFVRMQAYQDEVFDGSVESVALADSQDLTSGDRARFYKTEILIQTNGKRIFSGLNADVDVQTRHHAGVLRVPSQAVLGRMVDDLPTDIRAKPEVDLNKTIATVVFRKINGKAIITPVKVGPSDLTHTIVTSGLSEGETVITGPYKILLALAQDQDVELDSAITTSNAAATTTTTAASRPAN